jgi:hypothetical protein
MACKLGFVSFAAWSLKMINVLGLPQSKSNLLRVGRKYCFIYTQSSGKEEHSRCLSRHNIKSSPIMKHQFVLLMWGGHQGVVAAQVYQARAWLIPPTTGGVHGDYQSSKKSGEGWHEPGEFVKRFDKLVNATLLGGGYCRCHHSLLQQYLTRILRQKLTGTAFWPRTCK